MSPAEHASREPGDVLRYSPSTGHAREGMAFVGESGLARDTFWRTRGDSDSHALTAEELASATLLFNVRDFDALDRHSQASRETWETYHPDDRRKITSQHGLQEELFIRCGAQPHLDTQIENAEARVDKAGREAKAADDALERRRNELTALQAQALVST